MFSAEQKLFRLSKYLVVGPIRGWPRAVNIEGEVRGSFRPRLPCNSKGAGDLHRAKQLATRRSKGLRKESRTTIKAEDRPA